MLHYRTTARSGLTAIAAVLALSGTPLAAQEIDPTAVDAATPVDSPAPASDPAPAATTDPLAPAEAEPAAEPAAAATGRATTSTRRAPASSAPRTRVAAPTGASPAAAPVSPAEPAAQVAAAPAPLPAQELAASPMTPDVAAAEGEASAVDIDQALPIAGAAGLALVGIAGLGVAMRRRRRRNPEEGLSYSEAHMWHEPAVARSQPAMPAAQPERPGAGHTVRTNTPATPATGWTTPSAFSWGSAAPAVAAAPMAASDRNEGRIDAALRGPTPDNPFLSLKKRLRRAAFFEQRDRAVRNGTAKPISPMAGLPKAMADKTANFVRGGNVTVRRELAHA